MESEQSLAHAPSQAHLQGTQTKPHESQPCKRACLVSTHRQHSAVGHGPTLQMTGEKGERTTLSVLKKAPQTQTHLKRNKKSPDLLRPGLFAIRCSGAPGTKRQVLW
ncbi:MAG: hypothetical protein ABI091_27125 [Ferruginibacter sp.]